MLNTKQIFSKYDNEITRCQYKNFNPTSILNLNLENKKTTFKLDLQDDFISKNIQYYIAGEISSTDSSKPYTDKSNVKMVDNFVAHLFSQIEVKKHGTLIDDIENPGISSTIKGCVEYPGLNVYNGKATTSGFESHRYEVKQFEAVGNLGELGLGFFNDIIIPIYKGDFEITFTRNSDNNVVYRWKTKKADGTDDAASIPNKGKVEIKTFYLRVPVIEYTSEAKYNLISELVTGNYFFQFKKLQCLQNTKVAGKTLYLDITTSYKSMNNPIWAFVVFQANRLNNQTKDNNTFDHANVRNLWIEVGGKRYPEENWDLDFENNYYVLAYEAFQDYKRNYFQTTSIPYIDKKGFKSMYPIYSIDITSQPQNVSGAKNSVILRAEFNKDVSAPSETEEGTFCYIVLVSKCMLRYEPAKNKITQEF